MVDGATVILQAEYLQYIKRERHLGGNFRTFYVAILMDKGTLIAGPVISRQIQAK